MLERRMVILLMLHVPLRHLTTSLPYYFYYCPIRRTKKRKKGQRRTLTTLHHRMRRRGGNPLFLEASAFRVRMGENNGGGGMRHA